MKTVFHLSTDDTDKTSELLGNIKNLWADQTVEIETTAVVLNAQAVEIATEDSGASDYLSKMIEGGLQVKVCSNSVEGQGIDEYNLLDGVEVVSSGVGEVNRLQEEGYNYIRI